MSKKRIIVRVQWVKTPDLMGRHWRVRCSDAEYRDWRWDTKEYAISDGRGVCRDILSAGSPSQLLIYNKDGKIGRGRNAEASYGCNSKAPG